MEEVLSIALPVVIKYAPELVADVKALLEKKGYTVQQIEDIFSAVVPYDKLGIDPNAPVVPE